MPLFGLFGAKEGAFLDSGANNSASNSDSRSGSSSQFHTRKHGRKGLSKGPAVETIVVPCACCGVLLTYRLDVTKFRCSVCHTTHVLGGDRDPEPSLEPVSYEFVKGLILQCLANSPIETEGSSQTNISKADAVDSDPITTTDTPMVRKPSLHETFRLLLNYLYNAFRSKKCLNESFCQNSVPHVNGIVNVNASEMLLMFQMLTRLPTKRPLYNALLGANDSLKKITLAFSDDPAEYRWLLVLFEIPFLDHAVMINREKYATSMISNPEIKSLTYDVFKRILGLIAHLKSVKVANTFSVFFSRLNKNLLIKKVDLVNLYITFQLQSYYRISEGFLHRRNSMGPSAIPNAGANVNPKEEDNPLLTSGSRSSVSRTSSKKKQDPKIRIQQYNNDWHLKTSAMVMSIFWRSNIKRDEVERLPCSNFYNSLVDFVNMRIDFDAWQLTLNDAKASENGRLALQPDELRSAIQYITGRLSFELDSFFFCQFPLLISLGNKISILEYEARRQMERKAEEAFINSLDKRVTFDVYFRVHVRRDYIVQDSLKCIEANERNLKKSLKVTFIDEPGVDAGGLRKEWFLLLTRLLFRPMTGMIAYVELSNLLWFNMIPQEDCQMYYLLGAVLGLAIYNSAILDLNFPKCFYKILLGKPVDFSDFEELQPDVASNLLKLKSFNDEELELLGLKFELDLHDEVFKENNGTRELIPNGSSISVNASNLNLYISKYYQFFLGEGIAKQLKSFQRGFNNVVGGNALSLFDAEEIRLMLCGSDDAKIDLAIWKSVTKYAGGYHKSSSTIVWLWEYLEGLSNVQQKKFLLFVTGSDRVPATGIQNLTFKVTRLGSNSNRLPVAHTCFNELCLYDYSSRDKFVSKLEVAFNESAGFGIK